MSYPRTVAECKSILSKLAFKYGVSPRLISDRLLSKEDKEDMLQGSVSLQVIEKAVEVWAEQGMCNYANGSGEFYSEFFSWRATKGMGKEESVCNRKFTP